MYQSVYLVVLLLVIRVLSGGCSVVFQDSRLYEGSSCELPDGRTGVCILNCFANTSLGQRKTCGFNGNPLLTCCPSKSSYPILERVCSDRNNLVRSNIKKRLEENLTLKQILRAGRKKPNVQRIHRVASNEHPHMAALGIKRGRGVIEWFCGGTVIHEVFVLTAAHCITNVGVPDVVRVGETDLTSNPFISIFGAPISQVPVVSSHIHEGYRPPLYYNDIALLRIESQTLQVLKRLLPACTWTAGELPTNNLLMMGYGAPAFSQEHNNKLYQGNLTTVKREECTLSYDGFTDLPKGISDSQICAQDPNGVLDTCEGDSGGPLQFNANDQTRTPYLVGITSFGVLCLDGNPGVYTRVGAYLDWIEGTIRNLTST